MPTFDRKGFSIHYEEFGEGFPVLLFAPGGMRSSIEHWHRVAPFDPTREFASQFKLIALDQRNAGESVATIRADHGWQTYAADHLALLDHLGVKQCHVIGGCIGGAFALKLIEMDPDRVRAAVLQQPIGLSPDNREVFYKLFDDWAVEQKTKHPDVPEDAFQAFRERMYGGDFVFSVSRDAVRGLSTPLLVLMGNDVYHPSATSREIVSLASNARLIERWKDSELIEQTVSRVREFLVAHTP